MNKPLIEDVNAQNFKNFVETLLNTTEERQSMMYGEASHKFIFAAEESELFKEWLQRGFISFLQHAPLETTQELEMSHANRIIIGITMGFKYASYLQEQRELEKIKNATI